MFRRTYVALALLLGVTQPSLAQNTTFESGRKLFPEAYRDNPNEQAQRIPNNSVAQAPATQQDMMVNVCVSFTRGMGGIEFWHMCPFAVYVGFCMESANIYQYTCDSALRQGTVQITYLPVGSRARVPVSGTDVVFKACAEPRVPRINRPVGTFGPPAIWSCN